MRNIMDHDGGAALSFSPQERIEQIETMDLRAMAYALTYLAGYAPAVCDAVLTATKTEPLDSVLDSAWREAFFGNATSPA